MILIPAFNEEGAVGDVIREVHRGNAGRSGAGHWRTIASRDSTYTRAKSAGGRRASPYRIIWDWAAAMQAGYKLAFELGYDYVIRVDGDGQHDPKYVPALSGCSAQATGCHMVIGSRFYQNNGAHTSTVRAIGIWVFRMVLRPILGKPVRDPTSGFVGVNRDTLQVFTGSFPLEYPEIRALVVLQRKRFRFEEVPVRMRKRKAGRSTITAIKSLYYIIHVLLRCVCQHLEVLKAAGGRIKHGSPAERHDHSAACCY